MSASGYNDPEKLAAALELARSFKSGGDSKQQRGRNPNKAPVPKRDARPPYQRPAAPTAQQRRDIQPTYKQPVATYTQDVQDFGPPPPSARQYGGLGRFGGPSISNGQQPVLGNAAADFLRRASKEEPTKLVGTPVAAERGPSEKTTGLTSAQSQAESATTCLFQETKPEGVEPGSILDTFFLLVNGEQIPKKDEQPITKEGAEQPDEQSTLVEASGTDTQCEAVESSITSLEESPMHQAFPASATGPDVSGQVIESSQATMEKQAAKKLCPRAASFVPSQAAAPIAEAQPQHAVASTLHNSEWNIQSFANNGVTPNAALPLPFNIPNTPVNPFIPNMVPQNTAHVQNVGTHEPRPSQPSNMKEPGGGLQSSRWAT